MGILRLLPAIVAVCIVFLLAFSGVWIIQIGKDIKKTGWSFKGQSTGSILTRLLRSAACVVMLALCVVLAVKILHVGNSGWSFQRRTTMVRVKDPDYVLGTTAWEEMDYASAEEAFQRALTHSQDKNGAKSPQTAMISRTLGTLYLDIGKYNEAVDPLVNASVVFQKKYGEQDGITIETKALLAISDIKRGNYEQGFAALNTLYDNANYYQHKIILAQLLAQNETYLGNYSRALDLYDVLLQFYMNFNVDGTDLITDLQDYAVLEITMGDYAGARETLEIAKLMWTESNQVPDGTIAQILYHLSLAYGGLGDTDKALETAESALNIQISLYGEKTVFAALSYRSLADVYLSLGQYDKQAEYLNRALALACSSVGENHMATAGIYCGLGDYYKAIEDYENSLHQFQHALEIHKNILGAKSNEASYTYESLSEIYRLLQNYDQAVECAQYAEEICEALFGAENPNTAHTYLTLAWAYADCGRLADAECFALHAIDIYALQPEYTDAMRAYAEQTLGYVYFRQDRLEDAINAYDYAVSLYEAAKGPNSDAAMETYVFKGDAYITAGNIESGSKAYHDALVIAEKRMADINASLPLKIANRIAELYSLIEKDKSFPVWFEEWRNQ